jgi:hypothetical protein
MDNTVLLLLRAAFELPGNSNKLYVRQSRERISIESEEVGGSADCDVSYTWRKAIHRCDVS